MDGRRNLLAIETIYPCCWWAVAAFRPAENPEITQRFNDLAWLGFIGVVSTTVLQCLILAAVTLTDKRDTRLYPRWFGYFQLWCAALLSPAAFIYLFKTGPLAWNGILAFWIPVVTAGVWVTLTSALTARAITTPGPNLSSHVPLADRVAAIERQLAAPGIAHHPSESR